MTTPIIAASDIQARVAPDVYLRMFDRDRDGVADAAYLTTCIATADSKVRMRLAAAFPIEVDAAGGTVDEAIKGACVSYACLEAVIYNPLFNGTQQAPFAALAKMADEFFDRLVRDNRNRPKTSAMGRAKPWAATVNSTDSTGAPTNPMTRVADGKDGSGY
jgi:hypothetical protein